MSLLRGGAFHEFQKPRNQQMMTPLDPKSVALTVPGASSPWPCHSPFAPATSLRWKSQNAAVPKTPAYTSITKNARE